MCDQLLLLLLFFLRLFRCVANGIDCIVSPRDFCSSRVVPLCAERTTQLFYSGEGRTRRIELGGEELYLDVMPFPGRSK